MIYTKNDIRFFPSTTGIYKISFKNNNNGKVYIGSASGIKNKIKIDNGFHGRWKRHIYDLSKNKSKMPALQNAVNKYGINNILFEIIEECEISKCIEREQFYIDKYDSYNNGYNSRQIASNNKGLICSDERKLKIALKSKINRNNNYEQVKKLYNDGKSTRKIANELHMSRNTIKKIFDENKIAIRKDKGQKKKIIYQYDMLGNLITKFNSITECAKFLNINKQGIKYVLQEKCRHCNNLYYNYKLLSKDEVLNNINDLRKKLSIRKYINIKQINENNEIKIWKDIKEIINFYPEMKNYGIRRSLIQNIKYKGFYWFI